MDVDDVEEQEFLRLSSELGAEFVRLVLGEAGRDGDEGTASMGPGDGKESEGASGGSEEPPRDPPPKPDNPVIRSLALKLRQTGNEIDSPDLERVLRVMTPVLQKISVFQVTQTVFSSICDRVLGGIQTSSGWTQAHAVYQVTSELIQQLRREEPNPTPESTLIFLRFTGQYLTRVGLSGYKLPFLQAHLASRTGVDSPTLTVTPSIVEGLAHKTVLVTNEEQHILWEEYGLRLHIPSNSLPEDCSQFELEIDVGLPEEFELPGGDGTIVSAVYSLSHGLGDKRLRQPVTLEMQHCAASTALDNLSVIRANAGSNQFTVVPGGDFTSSEGYGAIKLFKFSRFAEWLKRSLRPLFPIEYSARTFYTNIIHNQFHLEFCIIRNMRVLSEAVRADFAKRDGSFECGPGFRFQFQANEIHLEIPESCSGWKMKRLNPLVVYKQDVDSYTIRKDLCPCVVRVWWDEDGNPTPLVHEVKLNGAKEHCNFLTVTSPKQCIGGRHRQSSPRSDEKVTDVKPKLSQLSLELSSLSWAEIQSVAVQLDMDYDQLIKIEEHTQQIDQRLHRAMNTWLKTDQKASWKKVVTALEACNKNVLAKHVRQKYCTASSTAITLSAAFTGDAKQSQ